MIFLLHEKPTISFLDTAQSLISIRLDTLLPGAYDYVFGYYARNYVIIRALPKPQSCDYGHLMVLDIETKRYNLWPELP